MKKMGRRRIDGELLTQAMKRCGGGGDGCFCHGEYHSGDFQRWVEGSDKLWERVVVLPNIEGQKYSFGELFEGREEQGEFIYFDWKEQCSDFIKEERHPLVEVTIVENQYWIISCKDTRIWINDVKIEKKTKARLNFGDFLQVRCDGLVKKTEFWFKERELDPAAFIGNDCRKNFLKKEDEDLMTWTQLDPDIEFTPGTNELVLSHILSYLEFRHLKQARLVSKLWNTEATKIMRKRYFVHFDIDNYIEADSSLIFFRYAQEMKNMQMTNWNVSMDWEVPLVNPKAKLYQDLDWFLGEGHNVKKLRLETYMYAAFDFEVNIKILDHVQHTLQDLDLSWDLSSRSTNAKASEKDCQLLSTIRFKNLKTFTLSFITHEDEDGNDADLSSYTWILEPLVEAIRGVSTIRLDTTAHKSSPFPNLVATEFSYERELEYSPEDLKCIMELDKPLTKLEIVPWDNMTNRQNAHYLEELFLKHSKTLQYLKIIVSESDEPGIINLPEFPNLKQLIVGIYNGDDNDEKGELNEMCTIKFHNPSNNGIIDYARHFPSLRSLTVTPTGFGRCGEWDNWAKLKHGIGIQRLWKKYADFFKVFFPIRQNGEGQGPQQICNTVKYLDIPYEAQYTKGYHPRRLFPRAAEIASMFPNVLNRFLNKARTQTKRVRPPATEMTMKLRSSAKL